jgi:hypothetical protein
MRPHWLLELAQADLRLHRVREKHASRRLGLEAFELKGEFKAASVTSKVTVDLYARWDTRRSRRW